MLDVGCGPGRHAIELARRGIPVVGVDISAEFVDIARATVERDGLADLVRVERGDARKLAEMDHLESFDAVVCLCQGAFGLMTRNGDDEQVIAGIRSRLRPSGRLALSAFNAYFAVKYHEGAEFDAEMGVSHEITDIRNSEGDIRSVDLWTGCYTPRELRFLLRSKGFHVDRIVSVEPGAYVERQPSVESPEYLVVATAI